MIPDCIDTKSVHAMRSRRNAYITSESDSRKLNDREDSLASRLQIFDGAMPRPRRECKQANRLRPTNSRGVYKYSSDNRLQCVYLFLVYPRCEPSLIFMHPLVKFKPQFDPLLCQP